MKVVGIQLPSYGLVVVHGYYVGTVYTAVLNANFISWYVEKKVTVKSVSYSSNP